jgi:hypothetical protein
MDIAVILHGLRKIVNRINAIEYSGGAGACRFGPYPCSRKPCSAMGANKLALSILRLARLSALPDKLLPAGIPFIQEG